MPSARAVPATILDSLFSDPFFSVPAFTAPRRPVRGLTAATTASVRRSDGRVLVTMDLPGLRPEDLELTVTADGDGAVVSVRGERRDARGTRSVRWSARLRGIDADQVTGDLTDGVLTLAAPETSAGTPRRVEVTSGSPVVSDQAALDADAEPPAPTGQEPAAEA